jgi:hypothetical protein
MFRLFDERLGELLPSAQDVIGENGWLYRLAQRDVRRVGHLARRTGEPMNVRSDSSEYGLNFSTCSCGQSATRNSARSSASPTAAGIPNNASLSGNDDSRNATRDPNSATPARFSARSAVVQLRTERPLAQADLINEQTGGRGFVRMAHRDVPRQKRSNSIDHEARPTWLFIERGSEVRYFARPKWKPIVWSHIERVRADAEAAKAQRKSMTDEPPFEQLYGPIYRRVDKACAAAKRYIGNRFWKSSAEAAFGAYHRADVELVHLLTDDQLRGKVPEVLAMAAAYLPGDDPRRTGFERRWPTAAVTPTTPAGGSEFSSTTITGGGRFSLVRAATSWVAQPPVEGQPPVSAADREQLATTLQASYLFLDLAQLRLRQFRNVLVGVAITLFVFLGGLTITGLASPTAVPMCGPVSSSAVSATPTGSDSAVGELPAIAGGPAPPGVEEAAEGKTITQICATGGNHPTGGDVALVALFGMIGGTLAGARALSTLGAASTRYSVERAQAAVKVMFGGITAVLGILFVRVGHPSGLLDSQAQILVLAVVFGYSQQLLTGLIDKRAITLTSDASPTTPAPAQAGATQQP